MTAYPQEYYGDPLFKAAGVSFENRSEILRRLHGICPWRTIRVYRTSYNGEAAIALYDENTGSQLGWVPKDLVRVLRDDTKLLTGEIVVGPDRAGLRLYPYHRPTPSVYWPVKRALEAQGKTLPPYNEAAYLHTIALMRNDKKGPI